MPGGGDVFVEVLLQIVVTATCGPRRRSARASCPFSRRICGRALRGGHVEDVTRHKPVEEHSQRGEVLLEGGRRNSPCRCLMKAATWKACTPAIWPMPRAAHHSAKRRVAFRYAFRVWSLLIWAVKNSRVRGRGRCGGCHYGCAIQYRRTHGGLKRVQRDHGVRRYQSEGYCRHAPNALPEPPGSSRLRTAGPEQAKVRNVSTMGSQFLGPQGSDFQTVGLLPDSSAGSEKAGPGMQQVGRRMSPLCYPRRWARNGQASYPFSRS